MKTQLNSSSHRHGHLCDGKQSPEYRAWRNMKRRCLDPSGVGWARYGGRGITVCQRWLTSFDNFLADMGPHPGDGYSIDRIDNNGNYEPGNCRWATRKQQIANKRTTRLLTYQGRTQCLSDWAAEFGIESTTLAGRIDRGVPIELALTSPSMRGKTWKL